MSKLTRVVGAILGLIVFTPPCIAQNAPGSPRAGMSAEELELQGGQSRPEPPRQSAPPASAAGSNPSAGLTPAYNPSTGRYELPCTAAAKSDPYASLRPVYNSYTGKYELPCSK